MSVEIAIDPQGIAELQRKLDRLDKNIRSCVDEALSAEVSKMCVLAQRLAPKRTGFLASTISAEKIGEWTFKLGATVTYAYFVEFGTRFMKARRFLTRALESSKPSLLLRINQAVREAIMEASST